MKRIIIFLGLFWLTVGISDVVIAQTAAPTDSVKLLSSDTLKGKVDKKSVAYVSKRFNPRKALLFSAILPGAGQVYNKKYWKVPLVYGGILGFLTVVKFYHNQTIQYGNQVFAGINYPSAQDTSFISSVNLIDPALKKLKGATQTQLENITNQSRRQRDYFIVITGLFYILQMVDAHVDAHLKEFKINPSLQVAVEPRVEQNYLMGRTSGMALVFKF